MRFVFMDEAGTSKHEPVTVVVAIVGDADRHVAVAEAAVSEALGAVPERFRDKFVFHAMQVFGDKKYHEHWRLTDRLDLLKTMMSVPRRVGMDIIVSAHWRGSVEFDEAAADVGVTSTQFEHLHTFSQCAMMADRTIRKRAGPLEVATIVAEDVPEMRKYLRLVPSVYRGGFQAEPWMLRETITDKEAGFSTQTGDFRITRIRKAVHFVEKADDPLVQVADACAYGFRRFFAQEKFGPDFAAAILGDVNLLRNFASPGGTESYLGQQR